MAIYGGPDIVTDGLVLHLDAGNTKSYPGSGTSWFDLSGNNNNGTLTNGPTYSSANRGSIVFDGINDYFKINSFNPIIDRFTISAFVYPSVTSGGDVGIYGGTIFSQDSVSDRYPLWLRVKGNELSYNMWDAVLPGITTSGANILFNQWYLITVVAQKNGILQIFKNSERIVNSTCPNRGIWTGDFYIGDLRDNRDIRFGGSIGTVCVYNNLLSGSQILQNYNATKGRYFL